jgi:hypothetical protein
VGSATAARPRSRAPLTGAARAGTRWALSGPGAAVLASGAVTLAVTFRAGHSPATVGPAAQPLSGS